MLHFGSLFVLLAHLLVAGCDIRVRISVYSFVPACIKNLRPSSLAFKWIDLQR